MSEELKTIKELADELGVNKQNVQYHIKSLPNKERLKNEKGIILLTIDEQNFIRAKILKISTDKVLADKVSTDKVLADKVSTDKVLTDKVSTDKVLTDKENNFLIEKIKIQEEQIRDLKEQRRNGKEQLDIKDSQIAQMQNLLDQQQRLALQDKKLLEEYKSEINELTALKMPQEDMKEDSSIRGEPQEEIERLKAQLKLSEEERNKSKEKEPVKTESKKWWQLWK
ncbi:DUF536 domain-containing protein [Lactococcus petauri]|uniref:DUF536 domain-containing protein n=1 Tax=Lactococcus petauri TaxID=1940789 RepID=UPI0022E8A60C|nr:DUF536 domain-containing protein [Lactococcus petauri]